MVFSQEIIYLNKGWTHVINIYQFKSKGTHWIALYINRNNPTYLDSFGVEHIQKK